MPDLTEQKVVAKPSPNRPAPSLTPQPEDKPAPDHHTPRIAVIGVHGVAHHDPGATANAMAGLLLSLPAKNHDDARYYDSFRSVGIQVPLQRLVVRPPVQVQRETLIEKMFSFLQEKSADFAYMGTQHARGLKAGESDRGSAGRAFMRLLLQHYEGGADGDAYVTTRLEGSRAAGAPGGPAEVHIYEVLWADLARPTNTLLSFFLSLFQLLFHLGSLSRLAVDSGAAENPDLKWKAFRRVQRYAVRMLQLPIPLLKVILLIALFSCIPALSQSTHDKLWFPLVMGGVAGVVITFLLNRRRTRVFTMSPGLWALRAIFPAALGIAAAGAPLAFHWVSPDGLSAFESWLILGLALLFYVLDKYKNVRRGAKPSLLRAINSGDLELTDVVEWLEEVEGWGDQHVYLYHARDSLTTDPIWKSEDNVKLRLPVSQRGFWDADSLVFPETWSLTGISIQRRLLALRLARAPHNAAAPTEDRSSRKNRGRLVSISGPLGAPRSRSYAVRATSRKADRCGIHADTCRRQGT